MHDGINMHVVNSKSSLHVFLLIYFYALPYKFCRMDIFRKINKICCTIIRETSVARADAKQLKYVHLLPFILAKGFTSPVLKNSCLATDFFKNAPFLAKT